MAYFTLIFAAVFANNFILVQFLGICPFLGVSKKTESALGMGFAVIFVMGLASLITYSLNQTILIKFNLQYLQTIIFIFIIAALVQIVEMVIKRFAPTLYSSLGVYLPLITTNCAILGVAILNVTSEAITNIGQAFLNGIFSGVGFTLALVLMAGIRERMAIGQLKVPKPFRGFPITLIIASIMSMGFVAFTGIQFS